jgi:hypothetical protein
MLKLIAFSLPLATRFTGTVTVPSRPTVAAAACTEAGGYVAVSDAGLLVTEPAMFVTITE